MLLAAGAVLAACGDDANDDAAAKQLCLVVQAWSDATVDAVRAFRTDSRELDPDNRRTRYAEAFTILEGLRVRFGQRVDDLDLDQPVAERLQQAMDDVARTVADGAAEAAALPDAAYTVVSVGEGSLVTGVEKAKAVVFQALNELADAPATGITRGCGRRGALDMSPSATFP